MTRKFSTSIAAALLIAPAAILSGLPNNDLVLQPDSRLWVTGTSTVRAYECAAAGVDATVIAAAPEAPAAILAGQKAVTAVSLVVPSAQLDCDNGTMNEHMLKALNASRHGEIRFQLSSYELVPGAEGRTARLTGSLELNGTSKEIAIDASVRDGGEGALRVAGTHEILMSEYGIRAPRLMLGTLRVHDPVVVHFDLRLRG